MSVVISRLMGGLGNQMFQYAAGLALADHLGVPLMLDRTVLDDALARKGDTPRELALDGFRAPLAFVDRAQVAAMLPRDLGPLRNRARSLLPNLFPKAPYYRETSRAFDPRFFNVKAPVLIDGYWQNEHYFKRVAVQLRGHHFSPNSSPSPENQEMLQRILATHGAAVHVRRGDYVTHQAANQFHGTCSVAYYTSSAKLLVDQHGVEHFFVFSDDPHWVREHIPFPKPVTYITHNSGREAQWDIFLMKHCRHYIIANSSFSWWGAWLGEKAGGTVIAPGRWFKGLDMPITDIIPHRWTIL